MGVREELTGRLDLGLKRYNHGVRVNDDTRSWGTPTNSWLDMAKEEFLVAVIYIIADYLRTKGESFLQDDEPDDNKRIMSIVDDWENIDSPQHKMLLWNMFNMLNKISTQGK